MQFERKIKKKDSGVLPTDLLLFLQPTDSKSITVGNSFSNQRMSWIACEDKLAFISNVNNGVLLKIDLSDYLSDFCTITCGEEVLLPGFSSALLVLGCETNLGGLLLFYHPTLRRMIRIVEIDVGVAVVHIISNGYRGNPLLPELLSCMDGILAVGGIDGSLILLDLQYSFLRKVLKGENNSSDNSLAWPSKVSKLQYVSRLTDTWHSIKQKIELCQTTHDSLALLLNDNEGELMAPKHGNTFSAVTCLHYCPAMAALFAGYEVGVWQMWSITDFEKLYSSKSEVGLGVSVVGLSVMEPCDDPRHYLYLWVGHSRSSRPAFLHRNFSRAPGSPPNSPLPNYPPLIPSSQEPPFSLLYSLAFAKKSYVESYGLIYSEFYKCDDIFELEMVREIDTFISGRILSVDSLNCANPYRKYQSNREDDKEILRVWSIVWECEFEEVEGKTVYITLFDLNQWYNKMPGRPDIVLGQSSRALPIHDTPYLSTWYFPPSDPDDQPLSVRVDPLSLEAFRFLNQLDCHYYPSNISYSCIKVGTRGICQGEGISVVNEFKDKLRFDPVGAMACPEPLFHTSLSLGILPNFDDTSSIHSITINADIARRYLLTICVENGLVDVILGCARYWYDSACTETTISLDFLVDFLWDLFTSYNRKIDELCICLFDYSGVELNYLDTVKIKLLNQYMKDIKAVYAVLSRDYSTFSNIYVVNNRYVAIDIKTLYVDLVSWFTANNLLPESSASLPYDLILPYNFKKMRSCVNERRIKGPLLIDEMLMHWISGEVQEWKRESGEGSAGYPPSSIQDIIRISLLADIEAPVKHFFILYFLQDLLECLASDRYSVDMEKIIHNYEATFRLHEGQMRIVLSYRDIDCKNFKDGVKRLLHRTVKNSDLEVWEHRHIIKALYLHKEYPLAFRYLKGMQPPLGSTDDNKMEISLNVCLGNVSSAFFITQQWSEKRQILLKHFFQECLRMNKIKFVYPLPLNKYEEECFLEFLRCSGIKSANDLILYYYIDRHRYPEAFVLYDKMKRLGQCNGQDKNSKKRDMIMKNLENRFDPKLLLLQKSKCEAKNTQPPSGFFEENWKPTSYYLKFDDTNPKRPLLKSSIKELAYITVWQGQKLSRMQLNKDDNVINNEMGSAPLIERVQVLEKSELADCGKKRFRAYNDLIGTGKKPKLFDRLMEKLPPMVEPSTPSKNNLNYSVIQEMVSTPRIELKTPRKQSPTPGPPSILRLRSDKKEEVSSCDESTSTTPRKKLKFALPSAVDDKTASLSVQISRPLQLGDISDSNESEISAHEEESINAQPLEELIVQDVESSLILEKSSEEGFSAEEEKSSDTGSSEKISQASSVVSQEEILEREQSLEDRLQQLQSRNRKLNSFINDPFSTSKENVQAGRDILLTKDSDISFISSHSSELCEDANNKNPPNLESVAENRESPLVESKWQLENNLVPTVSEEQYDNTNDDSSTSDSMDKVYTSVGAPIRKLSTIFETEGENEEPCPIISDHMNAETTANEQKDNLQGNYHESDLGDEKLDQDCDYNMQFGHENYSKEFDSESENNNEDSNEESKERDQLPLQKNQKEPNKDIKKSNDPDIICLSTDSESEGERDKVIPRSTAISKVYSDPFDGDESSSKLSSSQEDEHSEADEYDEESDDSVEEEEIGEEIDDENELKEQRKEERSDSDIEVLSDNDVHEYTEEECEPAQSECESISDESHHDSLSESPKLAIESLGKPIGSSEELKVSTAINPVDPSLLEKIVSFSKTVSAEELKDLVNVVKTTHDVKKCTHNEAVTSFESHHKPADTSVSKQIILSHSDSEISPTTPCEENVTDEGETIFDQDKSDSLANSVLSPSEDCDSGSQLYEHQVSSKSGSTSIHSSAECKEQESDLVANVNLPHQNNEAVASDLIEEQHDLIEKCDLPESTNKREIYYDKVEKEQNILEAVELQPINNQFSILSGHSSQKVFEKEEVTKEEILNTPQSDDVEVIIDSSSESEGESEDLDTSDDKSQIVKSDRLSGDFAETEEIKTIDCVPSPDNSMEVVTTPEICTEGEGHSLIELEAAVIHQEYVRGFVDSDDKCTVKRSDILPQDNLSALCGSELGATELEVNFTVKKGDTSEIVKALDQEKFQLTDLDTQQNILLSKEEEITSFQGVKESSAEVVKIIDVETDQGKTDALKNINLITSGITDEKLSGGKVMSVEQSSKSLEVPIIIPDSNYEVKMNVAENETICNTDLKNMFKVPHIYTSQDLETDYDQGKSCENIEHNVNVSSSKIYAEFDQKTLTSEFSLKSTSQSNLECESYSKESEMVLCVPCESLDKTNVSVSPVPNDDLKQGENDDSQVNNEVTSNKDSKYFDEEKYDIIDIDRDIISTTSGKMSDSLVVNELRGYQDISLNMPKDVPVDSSNEHMITMIAGNKTFSKPESQKEDEEASQISELKEGSETDHLSSFNTAVCEQSSGEIVELENDVSDLNTAMVLEDESFAINTPISQKNATRISEHSGNKKNVNIAVDINLSLKGKCKDVDVIVKAGQESDLNVSLTDSSLKCIQPEVVVNTQELGTMEVGREVKAFSKSRKKVQMVDKCIMTEKRRHSTRRSSICDLKVVTSAKSSVQSNVTETLGKQDSKMCGDDKPKLVDRSMVTDKRGIDFTIMETEVQTTPRRSKRRSSSLQPDEKRNEKQQLDNAYSGSMDSIHNLPLESNNKMSSNKKVDLTHQSETDTKDNRLPSSQNPSHDENVLVKGCLLDPKAERVIKKAIRRSLKQDNLELESEKKKVNKAETLPGNNNIALDTIICPSKDSSSLTDKKPAREIRKAVRRKSSVTPQESTASLAAIPENNELIIESGDTSCHPSSSLHRRHRSSSEPDLMMSLNDDQNEKKLKQTNVGKLKYSSTEDLSSGSAEGTPRRSRRVHKPTEFFSSPSSVASEPSDLTNKKMKLGKKLDFEEEQGSGQISNDIRKQTRRSKLNRRSNLEDIVEVSESDLDSTNSGERGQEHGHNLRRRHTMTLWEQHSKTDLTQLALQKAGASRRRTQSSSSEHQMTESDSENCSDVAVHYLRSSTRSDISESTIGSQSSCTKIKAKAQKNSDDDVLVTSTQTQRPHAGKNITHQHRGEASGEESDSEAPPYSPLTVENASPQHKAFAEDENPKMKKESRRRSVTSSIAEKISSEHGKPARIRKRTMSASSEPPPVIKHSPLKKDHVEESKTSIDIQKRGKSHNDPLRHLTGLDLLRACDKVKRRSKSLHEGNQILPYGSSIPPQADKSHSSLYQTQSPHMAAIIDEYSENRRLTRHQKSLIEKSFENSPRTPELTTTPKRRRRSSVVAGSEDESTPVRSSKRLQEKSHKKDG